MKERAVFTARQWYRIVVALILMHAASILSCDAQDLEPRRWSHLPVGTHVAGLGYAYTGGDVLFDPVLRIENAEFDLHSAAFKYVGTFALWDKLARFDFLQGYQEARWAGLLDGAPASTSRTGWSDTVLRFSMDLIGAPPLRGEEFAEYRKKVAEGETIVGVGLVVHLPTGNYFEDKLLNLGANRFTFRPQLGAVHQRGKWSMELTASSWIFTDNDDFFGGGHLELSPLYTVQSHCVYTFRPGVWMSAGLGYGGGAESTLNGINKGDRKENLGFGISLGLPISKKAGFQIGYVGLRAQQPTGVDLDTFATAVSFRW